MCNNKSNNYSDEEKQNKRKTQLKQRQMETGRRRRRLSCRRCKFNLDKALSDKAKVNRAQGIIASYRRS